MIPEARKFGDFNIEIRKQGILNRFFLKENVEIGKKEIDDSLLIHSDMPEVASEVLRGYKEFLAQLSNKRDLEKCEIQSLQGSTKLTIRCERITLKSLLDALEIIKTLSYNIISRKSQMERQF